ncbi:MAG: DUF969 domain-containing protein [Brevundimonas sp.]|uniref:DUF969 domain-containing protein n=1 Tax=Brevundimonas sp. TaxID=1871086 RepID=UPI00260363B7|nr:DUF969 domain-containing protein [Brevundimonas sp.]MDI6623149.1 DUF969 domain-containing protein [Brevundimonas sp.]MDQ7811132.1 DUF969 domain-containing protein [Brevundimonas sp.]
MWVLLGIAVLVAGFVARLNPLAVILVTAVVTGVAAAFGPGVGAGEILQAGLDTIAAFGKAFNDYRYISVIWLVLPLIGLLERHGLQERARILVAKVRSATTGRILLAYFVLRQISAAAGLTKLGGHPQMVRPLIAPMAEAAAETRYGDLPDGLRYRIRAHAAAVDNIALFFGEDIFFAIASILLIKGFLEANGILLEPWQLAMWAIPTAICALIVHGFRLMRLDRTIAREAGQ